MYYPNEGHICSTIIRALGTGEGQAPLEFRFYRVKFFKMGKISFFILFGPPLRKNRSQGPDNDHHQQML